jgi:hypothetical protein
MFNDSRGFAVGADGPESPDDIAWIRGPHWATALLSKLVE